MILHTRALGCGLHIYFTGTILDLHPEFYRGQDDRQTEGHWQAQQAKVLHYLCDERSNKFEWSAFNPRAACSCCRVFMWVFEVRLLISCVLLYPLENSSSANCGKDGAIAPLHIVFWPCVQYSLFCNITNTGYIRLKVWWGDLIITPENKIFEAFCAHAGFCRRDNNSIDNCIVISLEVYR